MRVFFAPYVKSGSFIEVADGSTVADVLHGQIPDHNPDKFVFRVNREPVQGDPLAYVLQDNDRLTLTPKKIEGYFTRILRAFAIRLTRRVA